MTPWRRLAPEEAPSWDALAAQSSDATLFQLTAWAEHKAGAGWRPVRWEARDDCGRLVAAIQALFKNLPLGRTLAWAPGGPLTGFPASDPKAMPELLRAWTRELSKERCVYARVRSHRPEETAWSQAFGAVFKRPSRRINSGLTLHIDLSQPLEALLKPLGPKHRHRVRYAAKSPLEWRAGNDPDLRAAFAELYREMAQFKSLAGQLFDADRLPGLIELFGSKALVLVGFLNARPVTGCLTIEAGPAAFYLASATSAEGRRASATYALVPKLFELLKARGVTNFDFGGIDPANPNARGVDDFKGGFGGREVRYLDEWDWSFWEPLRRAVNLAIAYRGV